MKPRELDNDEILTATLTRGKALALGLLLCKGCGHPPNNHFDDGPCAHCGCKDYREGFRQGLTRVTS